VTGHLAALARFIRPAVAAGLVATLALGLLGHLVRDRSAAWGLLMYVPLVPIGLAAAAWDAIRRGRAIPRGRFVLGASGLLAAALAAWPMIGGGPGPSGEVRSSGSDLGAATGTEVSVLHWNVLWGGGKDANAWRWAATRREIVARGADLVVLSESPADPWLDALVADLGPGASRVQVANEPLAPYCFKLVACSRGPLRLVRREAIADGAAMVVEADVRGKTVRLMVVDGQSNPTRWRTPMLDEIAVALLRAKAGGEPIDAVLGDFNSVSRSLGFDAIAEAGYALASRSSAGWRGTFPSFLPLYDIDHVWVRADRPGLRDELFTRTSSDHRGQLVRFTIPD